MRGEGFGVVRCPARERAREGKVVVLGTRRRGGSGVCQVAAVAALWTRIPSGVGESDGVCGQRLFLSRGRTSGVWGFFLVLWCKAHGVKKRTWSPGQKNECVCVERHGSLIPRRSRKKKKRRDRGRKSS
jgi:hypothetical protein